MSEFKLTTVEEFEEATARLLETGAKVGADAWQFRVKNQTPHCKFGGPLPHQQANPTRVHLIPPEFFTLSHAALCAYAVLAAISDCYPPV